MTTPSNPKPPSASKSSAVTTLPSPTGEPATRVEVSQDCTDNVRVQIVLRGPTALVVARMANVQAALDLLREPGKAPLQ